MFFGNFHPEPNYADSSLRVIYFISGPLLIAAVFTSVVRIVSYIRWTGKYPFYFLFPRTKPSNPEPSKTGTQNKSKS